MLVDIVLMKFMAFWLGIEKKFFLQKSENVKKEIKINKYKNEGRRYECNV